MSITRLASKATRIIGRTSLATVTTGVTSGTAGASTTATSLAKPTAAANWTASNLVGKWLKVVGGGGADSSTLPVLRPILSNTTTTLAVNEVVGMDATTVFEVVDLQVATPTELDGLNIADATLPIEVSGFSFGSDITSNLVELADCHRVTLSGCSFDANTAGPSVSATRVTRLVLEHCRLTNGADVDINECASVTLTGLDCSAAGAISVSTALSCDVTKLTSVDAVDSVLRLSRIHSATAEVTASDGGATPVYLEDVTHFEAVGSALLAGTGNTGYGVEVTGSGSAILTGSTITGGTGDVLFYGHAVTWAVLSGTDYGIVEEHAGNALARAAYTKAIKYGNYLFDGSIDVSGRMLLYGYLNVSANLSVPTFTASESYDMGAQGVRGFLECVCNSASAQVLLPDGAAIAGVVVGIVNRGSATLTVKPPVGGTINGAASTTIATNSSRTFVSLNGTGGLAYWVLT